MKEKLKRMWVWFKKNILTKDMIIPFLIAEAIFWSPLIITALLALMVNNWYWTAFSSILLFWSGPFTPAIPLQIGLAFAIKKIGDKIRNAKKITNRSSINNNNADDSTETSRDSNPRD